MGNCYTYHQQIVEPHAFSGIEPPGERRKVSEPLKLYDVFINHRGPDVKDTLATQLYISLRELGIRAFLDSKEKELGDSFPSTIETAIRSASVHIAIFSKRYAESPWCLAELVLMLRSPAKIIPVFYDVQPSELRHIENGVYADAFTKYKMKSRYLEKLKEWKEALQSVSFITGEEFNGDCTNIVSTVREELERLKPKLPVAKYPVGLNKLVQDFEKKCLDELVDDFESQCRIREEGIVGIFGMGGIGKTTLSKELFNRKRSQYGQACFLFDVREASVKRELPCLQMKLVQNIFRENPPDFKSIGEGTSYIEGCIERNSDLSFLVVLDDIDHVDQLNALLIIKMLNKYGDSWVIITTRDVGVLVSTGITTGYNLKGMNRDAARELFCWHAFQQARPVSGYEDLVDAFLRGCQGLPLSLQVLGRHVHGRDQNYWRLELKKVRTILPQDIKQRLKISFDALDREEKQIFMDIACFFINTEKRIALRIWERSPWNAQHAIQMLKDKCLVEEEIKDQGRPIFILTMHDHLRDLGREMAKELSPPHRMWHTQDIESLEYKGFPAFLSKSNWRCLGSIKVRSMDAEIKYFVGNSDDWGHTCTSVLCLQIWFDYRTQMTIIPSWIPFQNLVCLNIRSGHLTRLWQNDVQKPSSLKELEIEHTHLEEFPNLSRMSNHLERVVLNGVNIPIEWWSFLETNPTSLAYYWQYNKYRGHATFESSSSHVHLRGLVFRGLVALNNKGQSPTVEPPMSSLRKVKFEDQEFVTKVLISGYHYPNMKYLFLDFLENLIEVDLKMVTTLVSLKLINCNKLKSVSGISDLTNLVELEINTCVEIEELPGLSHLSCLNRVSIEYCEKLSCLELDDCANFKTVNIAGLPELVIFSIRHCPELETIRIDRCQKLHNIASIEELPALKSVEVVDCANLETVHFESPSYLERIAIDGCEKLQNIGGIEISLCSNGAAIRNSNHNLQKVSWERMMTLSSFSLESMLGTLRGGLAALRRQSPAVESAKNSLRKVEFERQHSVTKVLISGYHYPNLESLRLGFMEKLAGVDLISVTTLVNLGLMYCNNLKIVSGIRDLTNLVKLYICDCSEIEELPGLSHLSCLNIVSLVNCGKLNCLELDDCAHLKTVYFSGLPKLVQFSIHHCSELETVRIERCEKLQNIAGIGELPTLKHTEISLCSNPAIRNSIHNLQRMPSEHMMVAIESAAEDAESMLEAHLFSQWFAAEEVIKLGSHEDNLVETMAAGGSLGAIIYCTVVAVHCIPPNEFTKIIVVGSRTLSSSETQMNIEERRSTIGFTDQQCINYREFLMGRLKSTLPEIRIEKAYMVTVKKGEEWKTLTVLKIICDQLFIK